MAQLGFRTYSYQELKTLTIRFRWGRSNYKTFCLSILVPARRGCGFFWFVN